MVDSSEVNDHLTPALREALPLAIRQAEAYLVPASRQQLATALTPNLTLVAGVGMSQAERTAWFAAAGEAMRGIPADLLAIGAALARETVDHPSKIVPAILAYAKPRWADRKTELAKVKRISAVAANRRERLPWEAEPFDIRQRATPQQVSEILRKAGMTGTPQ